MGNKQSSVNYSNNFNSTTTTETCNRQTETRARSPVTFMPGLKVSDNTGNIVEYYRSGLTARGPGKMLHQIITSTDTSSKCSSRLLAHSHRMPTGKCDKSVKMTESVAAVLGDSDSHESHTVDSSLFTDHQPTNRSNQLACSQHCNNVVPVTSQSSLSVQEHTQNLDQKSANEIEMISMKTILSLTSSEFGATEQDCKKLATSTEMWLSPQNPVKNSRTQESTEKHETHDFINRVMPLSEVPLSSAFELVSSINTDRDVKSQLLSNQTKDSPGYSTLNQATALQRTVISRESASANKFRWSSKLDRHCRPILTVPPFAIKHPSDSFPIGYEFEPYSVASELEQSREAGSFFEDWQAGIDDGSRELEHELAKQQRLRNQLNEAVTKQLELRRKTAQLQTKSVKLAELTEQTTDACLRQNKCRLRTVKAVFDERELEARLAQTIDQNRQLERVLRNAAGESQQAVTQQRVQATERHLLRKQLAQAELNCARLSIWSRNKPSQVPGMVRDLQAMLGRVRVYASIFPTPHESCLRFAPRNRLLLQLDASSMLQRSQTDRVMETLLATDKLLAEAVTFTQLNMFGSVMPHRENKTEHRVLSCHLTHVLPPTSEHRTLDLFVGQLEPVVEAVAEGLTASFVAIGPVHTGKSTLLLGDDSCQFGSNREATVVAGRAVSNDNFDGTNDNDIDDDWQGGLMGRKVNVYHHLASHCGIVGLALARLVRLTNRKRCRYVAELGRVDAPEVTACLLEVGLTQQVDQIVDLLAKSTSVSAESFVAVPSIHFFQRPVFKNGVQTSAKIAKAMRITCLADIYRFVENTRCRQALGDDGGNVIASASVGSRPSTRCHLVVVIHVPQFSATYRPAGRLVLVDTVGLEQRPAVLLASVDATLSSLAIGAWADASELVRALSFTPGWQRRQAASGQKKSPLLQLLRSLLIEQRPNKPDKAAAAGGDGAAASVNCLFFCLPSGRSELIALMLCFRLLLVAMQQAKRMS